MKRYLAGLFAVFMLFTLAACNKTNPNLTVFENEDVYFAYDDSKLFMDGEPVRDEYGAWTTSFYLKDEDGSTNYKDCAILSFANTFAVEKVLFDYNNEVSGLEVNTLKAGKYSYEYSTYTATYEGETDGESIVENQIDYYGEVEGGDVNLTIYASTETDISAFEEILGTIKIKHDFSGEFIKGCDFMSEKDITFNENVTVPVKLFTYGTTTNNANVGYISSYKNDTQIVVQYLENSANIEDVLKLLTTQTIEEYKEYLSGYELRLQDMQKKDDFVYNTAVFYSGNTPIKIFSFAVEKVSDDSFLLITINRENALGREEVISPTYFDAIKAYGINDYVSSVPSSEDRVDFE